MITSEKDWLNFLNKKQIWDIPLIDTIILAPHPDDETLGAGGLIFDLKTKKINVLVIAVTDGENAYPNMENLGPVRKKEQEQALQILGVPKEMIIRLQLKDGALKEEEDKLENLILPLINRKIHLLAPWTGDYHPDHEAVGRTAIKIAKQKKIPLSFYFFWTWHYSNPLDMNKLPLCIYPLNFESFSNKQKAIDCYISQLSKKEGFRPILQKHTLIPTKRCFEVYYPYEY